MIRLSTILASIIIFSGTLLISCSKPIEQMHDNYWEKKRSAFAASTPFECRSSLKFCEEVLKVNPHHPVMNYLAARLNEQLGNRDIAFMQLKRAAQLGYTSRNRWLKMHPMSDPAFSALRESEQFEEIVRIMNVSDRPVHRSRTAFTVKDKSIRTEGITYDPDERFFYLGSDHKIVRVDHAGNSSVFTREAEQDGLGIVNGIHVDPVRRTLWACSNDENNANAVIFKYDLSSGEMIKKYPSPADGTRHFFNDLVIHPNGDVYITDTGSIFTVPHDSDKLELFYKSKSFLGSNGITLSPDGKAIYATEDVWGICKIDIKTKTFARLTHGKEYHAYGIDGLYYADDYLYFIQNELLTQVSRCSLNEKGTHLEGCEVFERNSDELRAPTTGVIVGDYLYFIADTQGKGSKYEGVVVMKAPL